MCRSNMAASRPWKPKGGSRETGAGRKWPSGKSILPFVDLVVERIWRKVALLWAHAVQLGPLRSKLKSGWKITTLQLHDWSTSLSTLLFTFLTKPGSRFTLKPAIAICLLQLKTSNQLLIKTLTQGKGLPQTMRSIQLVGTPCLRYASYKISLT